MKRILAAARQQGYRPKRHGRALKISRTGAFTFVIPLLRNPIWARLQHGRAAAGRRARLRGDGHGGADRGPPSAGHVPVPDRGEARADGLLLATALRVPEHAAAVEVPHVYVNRRGPDRGNNVVMDEAAAVEMFIAHVAGLGHRTVTIIDGPPEVDTVHRRTRAARRACAAQGLSLVVRNAPPTEEGGWDATIRMLRRGPVPTACAVGSLNQLFGVMGALRAAQISVPSQMSLVSFDEDECLAFLEVPVTSISMPLAALGSAAVDALITRVEGGPVGDVMITEPIELVSRASVRPATGRLAAIPGGALAGAGTRRAGGMLCWSDQGVRPPGERGRPAPPRQH
jgi:DNA-binding LacI/PurR family transcriptional regulator